MLIGSHACSLEAIMHGMHVTNSIPLGRPLPLTVHTFYDITPRKELNIPADHVYTQLAPLRDSSKQSLAICIVDVTDFPGSLVPGLNARCAFSDRNLHARLPLDPTHVRLKRTCV
jgi:hypothetical protein